MTGFRRHVTRLGFAAFLGVASAVMFADINQLDQSFGVTGRVITPFDLALNGDDAGRAVAVRPADGRIAVGGSCEFNSSETRFCLAVYNPDGTLDASFDGDGMVTTAMIGVAQYVAGVAFQSDGKLVAAGGCNTQFFCLTRYNTNGSLDPNFGDGGRMILPLGTDLSGEVAAMVLQADERIVIAGGCSDLTVTPSPQGLICLARFNSNGTLDGSFGAGGIVLTRLTGGRSSQARAITMAGTDIVVAGVCDYVTCVARYLSTGALDLGFGVNGIAESVAFNNGIVSNWPSGVALQGPDILVAGTCNWNVAEDFCFARFNNDGSLDTLFGNTPAPDDNWAIHSVGALSDHGRAVVVQPDSRFVVIGYCVDSTFIANFCVVRFDTDGVSVDFALQSAFTSGGDAAWAGVLQSDGNLVVAGECYPAGAQGGADFCAARYGDALLIPTVTTQIHDSSHAWVTSIALGETVHHRVLVTGGGVIPGGLAIVDWFNTHDCSGSPAASSTAQAITGGVVDVTGFTQTPPVVGTYSFRARYLGDAAYRSATGPCDPLVVTAPARIEPTIAIAIHTLQPHGPIEDGMSKIGLAVHASARVDGARGEATGQVTQTFYGNDSCTGRLGVSSPAVSLDEGRWDFIGYNHTPTKRGIYAFRISFLGDDRYLPATGPCVAFTVVSKLTPTIATFVHDETHAAITSADVNDPLHVMAVLPPVNSLAPSGNVTVQYFRNGTCKGRPAGTSAPTLLAVDVQSGSIQADVTAFVVTVPAFQSVLSFNVVYSGDSDFVARTGPCVVVPIT